MSYVLQTQRRPLPFLLSLSFFYDLEALAQGDDFRFRQLTSLQTREQLLYCNRSADLSATIVHLVPKKMQIICTDVHWVPSND